MICVAIFIFGANGRIRTFWVSNVSDLQSEGSPPSYQHWHFIAESWGFEPLSVTSALVFKTRCPPMDATFQFSGRRENSTLTAIRQSTLAGCRNKAIFAFLPICSASGIRIRTCIWFKHIVSASWTTALFERDLGFEPRNNLSILSGAALPICPVSHIWIKKAPNFWLRASIYKIHNLSVNLDVGLTNTDYINY